MTKSKNKKEPIKLGTFKSLILIGLLLWGIGSILPGGNKSGSATNEQTRRVILIDNAKNAVRSMLKDPASAEFRDVVFARGKEGAPVACGEVNSKNSYGGYVGYKSFVSSGKPSLTFIEGQVDGFNEVWNKLCVK